MIIIKTWEQDVYSGANGGSVYLGICNTIEEANEKVVDKYHQYTDWKETEYGYIRAYKTNPGHTLFYGEILLIKDGYNSRVELQYINTY